jgi:hypothetical protein
MSRSGWTAAAATIRLPDLVRVRAEHAFWMRYNIVVHAAVLSLRCKLLPVSFRLQLRQARLERSYPQLGLPKMLGIAVASPAIRYVNNIVGHPLNLLVVTLHARRIRPN